MEIAATPSLSNSPAVSFLSGAPVTHHVTSNLPGGLLLEDKHVVSLVCPDLQSQEPAGLAGRDKPVFDDWPNVTLDSGHRLNL